MYIDVVTIRACKLRVLTSRCPYHKLPGRGPGDVRWTVACSFSDFSFAVSMLCPRRQIIMMRRVRRSSTNDSAELFSSGNSRERWTFQWLRVYTFLHYHTLIAVFSFFSINSHYWILSNLYCDCKKKFQEFCIMLLSLKQLSLKFEKIKIFIALWQNISFFKVYFVFGFCNVFIILVH